MTRLGIRNQGRARLGTRNRGRARLGRGLAFRLGGELSLRLCGSGDFRGGVHEVGLEARVEEGRGAGGGGGNARGGQVGVRAP